MIPHNTVRPDPRYASGAYKQNASQASVKAKGKSFHVGSSAHGTGHDHGYLEHGSHPSQASTTWNSLFVEALEEEDTFMSGDSQRHLLDKPSSLGTKCDSYPAHQGYDHRGTSRATSRSATHGGLDEWPSQIDSQTYRALHAKNSDPSSTALGHFSGSQVRQPSGSLTSSIPSDPLDDPGFSPWIGDHAEDGLTQDAVRQGVSAKLLVTDEKEEINTARHCVLPCLHNPTGLKDLSRFFNQVLQERKACSKLSHDRLSKAPSRVTVTEQKREAWLTKLANPTIPLFKQSRSIPRGLHGKFLLEQCVSKTVPVARAVWLVRRVGLDCMRALHRGSVDIALAVEREKKWFKDWTIVVESFAEDIDDRDGNAHRKQEATYITRLSARLYAEGLLDRKHYLDWVLNRLEKCSLNRLPLMLLAAQTHQAKLTSSKRYGQRLAAAFTSRLHEVRFHRLGFLTSADIFLELSESNSTNDVLKEMHTRLDDFVQRLASSHVKHFVFPKIWRQVGYLFIQKRTTAKEPSALDDMQRIISVNDRLSPWIVGSDPNAMHPTQGVIQTLDTALPHLDLAALSSSLRALMPNLHELVACLIGWATSRYRAGGHRLHLACRLIRQWHEQQGVISHESISFALTRLRQGKTISPTGLARFCAEMGRSSHFDQTAYLRGLSSTQPSLETPDMPFLLLLMAQVSTSDAPASVVDLHTQTTQSKIVDTDSEAQIVQVKQKIAAQFKSRSEHSDTDLEDHSIQDHLQKITFKNRFELSKSLCSSLLSLLARRKDGADTSLPLHFVKVVVILLEDLDDYFVLMDVLIALVARCSLEGLELIALSAETQDEKFAALGFHTKLWHTLFSRYTALRSVNNPPAKDLCQFFLRTSYWYGTTAKLEQHLNREIEFCDNGFAACTPLSEMQIDTAEDGRSDLDRILANGPKLADPDLSTALSTILAHLCHVKQISEPQVDTIKTNLTALRTANEESFAAALADWVRLQVTALEHQPLSRALTLLLRSGSMSISALLECAEQANNGGLNDASRTAEPKAVLNLLHFFFFEAEEASVGSLTSQAEEHDNLHSLDAHNRWSKQTWRQHLLRSHGPSLIRLLKACLKLRSEPYHDSDLHSLCTSPPFIAMFQRLLARSPKLMHDELKSVFTMNVTFVRDNVRHFLTAMMKLPGRPPTPQCLPQDSTDNSVWRADSRGLLISQLFEFVDACSLPTFQLALAAATEDDAHSDSQLVLRSCSKHIIASIERQYSLWPQLVSHIDVRAGKQLRIMSEKALLFSGEDEAALTHAFRSAWTTTPSTHAAIINATRSSIPVFEESEIGRPIAGHLKSAVKAIDDQSLPTSDDFVDWIRALISISLVHEQAFTMPADLTQLLYALCRITSLGNLHAHRDVIELAHDAACFFLPRATTGSFEQLKNALGPFMNTSPIQVLLDVHSKADPELYPTTNLSSFLPLRACQDSSMASV